MYYLKWDAPDDINGDKVGNDKIGRDKIEGE